MSPPAATDLSPAARLAQRLVPSGRPRTALMLAANYLLIATLTQCAAPATRTSDSPGVAFPMSLGEGSGDPHPEHRPAATKGQPRAQRTDPKAEHRKQYGSLPDPPPLKTSEQWELTLAYDGGTLSMTRAAKRQFEEPVVTARRMGRFAVELWIGRELIDRVRFDFPLVPEAPQDTQPRALGSPVSLGQDTASTQTLLIPDSPRATRALLVDRATGRETELAWPPARPAAAVGSAEATTDPAVP